ncbi:hypothetical protein B0H66DRAFT_486708 [Apodospora peruviana]|uniref:Actin-like ATPase domain-containing protein n=1 Tax=Apodospora peruviana TaxID=516989 RepID=A0AAE0HS78_9PEZI|nr:hypothetical protein B0H66DRAFT_486708 [Apodospora peruviana]
MSGETAYVGGSATSDTGFGSTSEHPWLPFARVPLPSNNPTVPEPELPYADAVLRPNLAGPDEPRVVLGLDYGTTHTGLAFMHQTMERQPSFPNDIHIFDKWTGGGEAGKIPSAISYSKTPRGCKQWGNDIDEQDSNVLLWTKLELQPQKPLKELESLKEALNGLRLIEALREDDNAGVKSDIPLHIIKSPHEVVQDFLQNIAREYYLYMRSRNEFVIHRGNVPVDIVITHPVDWPYEALNKTFRAVVRSFSKRMFPTRRNIYLVPEPEACAVFTVQDMIAPTSKPLLGTDKTFGKGECFVVCDAGGGTVDLVTYRIENLDPLELRKIGVVSGARCGATFIDQAFIKWIESKTTNIGITSNALGTGGHFVLRPQGRTILRRFESCKRQFTGTEMNTLTLPRSTIVDPTFTQCANGLLTITAEDMKRFFEFPVKQTIDLISRQVTNAEVRGEFVSHIFMSGGMSQSEYVLSRVKEWASTHRGSIESPANFDCNVRWTAVAKGAALCGMGVGVNNAILARPSPRHYGISGAELASSWKHADSGIEIAVDEVHGRSMALDQIIWLVSKDDALIPDKPVHASCRIACTFNSAHLGNGSTARLEFCATDMDGPAPTKLFEILAGASTLKFQWVGNRSEQPLT